MTRTNFQGQPFHLVTNSPWPFAISRALFSLALSNALWRHGYVSGRTLVNLSLITLVSIRVLWFKDVTIEGTYLGNHTIPVQQGINLGFIRFVLSEVRVFFSIFWAYLHSSLAPSVELGACWPPVGIDSLNYREIPLLNTALLLASGVTITYSHHAALAGLRSHALAGLVLTIVLGAIFTGFQAVEYIEAPFTIADSVYGSVFYLGTGVHGAHVLVGSLRLAVQLGRRANYHLTAHHHVGYETAILYWHFVDVRWLGLYAIFYVWAY